MIGDLRLEDEDKPQGVVSSIKNRKSQIANLPG